MYTVTITHFNDRPGTLTLDATTDAEARAEINRIVADGYRNGTRAVTTLSTGDAYGARNEHGRAVGGVAQVVVADHIELQQLINQGGYTQVSAAEALDVSPRMMRYYCAGDKAVPVTVMLAMRHLVECPPRLG